MFCWTNNVMCWLEELGRSQKRGMSPGGGAAMIKEAHGRIFLRVCCGLYQAEHFWNVSMARQKSCYLLPWGIIERIPNISSFVNIVLLSRPTRMSCRNVLGITVILAAVWYIV